MVELEFEFIPDEGAGANEGMVERGLEGGWECELVEDMYEVGEEVWAALCVGVSALYLF